jgi:hypothetical protein
MMKKDKVKQYYENSFFIGIFVDLNRRVFELESRLAETANKLEKTRNLLFMQYKINRDEKL